LYNKPEEEVVGMAKELDYYFETMLDNSNIGKKVVDWFTLKSLKTLLKTVMRHKFAWPFNAPVDVEGLNLYDYYDVVKNPMDFGTIKRRLDANNYYVYYEDFVKDMKLVFFNCYLYNQKGTDVRMMAETIEKIFEEKLLAISIKDIDKSITKTENDKKFQITELKDKINKAKDSGFYPSDPETLPFSSKKEPKQKPKVAKKDDSDTEHDDSKKNVKELECIRFLLKKVMKHKQAWPFNSPVDVKLLQLDDYYEIVKEPMDFGTIHRRLNEDYYSTLDSVISDIRLVFSNCYLYNDDDDQVVTMADEVERFFESNLSKIIPKSSLQEKDSPKGQSDEKDNDQDTDTLAKTDVVWCA